MIKYELTRRADVNSINKEILDNNILPNTWRTITSCIIIPIKFAAKYVNASPIAPYRGINIFPLIINAAPQQN